jgi:hypothetical protein
MNDIMKLDFLKYSLATVSLLLISIQAHAEQWYHVELVVFEQLNTVTDEQWPIDASSDTPRLSPNSATSKIQPAQTDTLKSEVNSLNRSSKYRVLYYDAWQQSMLTKRRASPIAITSTDGLINGSIKLYKQTYLHAALDIWLKENQSQLNNWSDASPDGIAVNNVRNPHLDQTRRIRSKKVFYFDHPKLGALLEITPITMPDAAQVNIEKLETFSLPTEAASTTTQ